tara:strand:+ start:926 stop:1195 length:270 start_codon:yes stop_codon:yes gene_type:complete
MSRYENTKNKSKNNKLYYKTTIYSEVPLRNDDIYIITQQGDRLDNLAYEFYGSPTYWWFIARVNNLKAMNVEAGLQLRIPKDIQNASGR